MLVEDLIKELEKFPKGTLVQILDHRKNLGGDDEGGSTDGIYKPEVTLIEIDNEEERQFHNERSEKPWVNWIAFCVFMSGGHNTNLIINRKLSARLHKHAVTSSSLAWIYKLNK